MPELKPCPFCGSKASETFDYDAVADSTGKMWAYQVTCNQCCATTGLCFSRERAIEAWNRRADNG